MLRYDVALLSEFLIPHRRLARILRHAAARRVQDAEIRLRSAVALFAALRNQVAAASRSCATPRPLRYMMPRLCCAPASPCSAALANHFTASTCSRATPRPLSYITPRLLSAAA